MSNMSETKHEKFERLASKRTESVLKKLDVLANCSNKSNYEYSEDDVERIFSAIEEKVEQVEREFEQKIREEEVDTEFSL